MGEEGETNSENLQHNYSRPPLIPQPHPWLIFSHGKDKQRQTFYSVSEKWYYVRKIPEMRNKIICCYRYGWLLLKDLKTSCYSFLNLGLKKSIGLPRLNMRVRSYIPLDPPDSVDDDACTLFICEFNYLAVWFNGESEYEGIDIELEDGYGDENDVINEAIICRGCLYGLTRGGKLLMTKEYRALPMRFENTVIQQKLLSKRHLILPRKFYMVTYCDELMVLIQTYSHLYYNGGRAIDFEIFRADFSKGTWEEVNHIGNRTVFLSSYDDYFKCCYIIDNDEGSSQNRLITNSIYFSEDGHLYNFDLTSRSISRFRPCPVSRRCSFSCWLQF